MKTLACFIMTFMFTQFAAGGPTAKVSSYPFPYMTAATNRIEILTAKSPNFARDILIEINSEGCAALTRLLADPNFQLALDQVERHDKASMPLRTALAEQDNLFFLSFVPIEEQAFIDAGLDKEATAALLSSLKEHRKLVSRSFETKEVLYHTDRLKTEFCESAKKLKAAETTEAEARIAAEEATVRMNNWRGAGIVAIDLGSALFLGAVGGPLGEIAGVLWAEASINVGTGMLTLK